MAQPRLPGPCLSSGATVHLPWQSAALATVCFAYSKKYPWLQPAFKFPQRTVLPCAPPTPFVRPWLPFPLGSLRSLPDFGGFHAAREESERERNHPRCHHRRRKRGQLPRLKLTITCTKINPLSGRQHAFNRSAGDRPKARAYLTVCGEPTIFNRRALLLQSLAGLPLYLPDICLLMFHPPPPLLGFRHHRAWGRKRTGPPPTPAPASGRAASPDAVPRGRPAPAPGIAPLQPRSRPPLPGPGRGAPTPSPHRSCPANGGGGGGGRGGGRRRPGARRREISSPRRPGSAGKEAPRAEGARPSPPRGSRRPRARLLSR